MQTPTPGVMKFFILVDPSFQVIITLYVISLCDLAMLRSTKDFKKK